MKKIIASTVGLLIAGGMVATNASAVENLFGGYWRTRAYIQDNFDGQDSSTWDRIDSRTRLYYTAKFSDDFKFVNKFEFNYSWGDDDYGDIGTDGKGDWRVKNSYADFNLGPVNAKIGMQGVVIGRGFLFDDDLAGIVVTPSFGSVKVPVFYTRVEDEDASSDVSPDLDMMGIMPVIKVSDNVSINPYFVYLTGAVAADYLSTPVYGTTTAGTQVEVSEVLTPITMSNGDSGERDIDLGYIGLDADIKMDALSLWATAIYNFGTEQYNEYTILVPSGTLLYAETKDADVAGYLLAAGVDAGIVHGAVIYASGDEDGVADGNVDSFVTAPGVSYYWAEIMGLGIFDNRASNNAPGNAITNAFVATAGVTVKPVDKLSLNFDAYWAAANEMAGGTSTFDSENELGLELDLKATYALMDNLNLDVVFAYLLSGDATGPEDVMEGGARLSLSF